MQLMSPPNEVAKTETRERNEVTRKSHKTFEATASSLLSWLTFLNFLSSFSVLHIVANLSFILRKEKYCQEGAMNEFFSLKFVK